MSKERPQKNHIKIFQDVTLKTADDNNSKRDGCYYDNLIIHQPSTSDKENYNNPNTVINNDSNSRRRRCTASTYFLDEDCVFSDSDEEKEYHRKILEDYNFFNASPKTKGVEVQCNLITRETEISDVIKRCASFNIENFNDDFRELILLCRQLAHKYKYGTPSSSKDQRNNGSGSHSATKDNSNRQGLKTTSVLEDSKLHNASNQLPPSRYSGDDFVSGSFENIPLNTTNIIKMLSEEDSNKKVDNIEPREENVDRDTISSRVQKSVKCNSSGVLTGKQRYKKLKRRITKRVNLRSVTKNLKKSAIVRNKGQKIKERGAEVVDVMSYEESQKYSVKRMTETLEDLRDHNVKIRFSQRQLRSLARNWMKADKTTIKNYESPDALVKVSTNRDSDSG